MNAMKEKTWLVFFFFFNIEIKPLATFQSFVEAKSDTLERIEMIMMAEAKWEEQRKEGSQCLNISNQSSQSLCAQKKVNFPAHQRKFN